MTTALTTDKSSLTETQPAAEPFVELKALRKEFSGNVAVDDVTLSIFKGEFFSLLGPSGCGKTTTLRMIAGLETLSGGAISIAGNVVSTVGKTMPAEARGVGIVFQDYALFPHMTVFENVAFGLHRQNKAFIADRVKELLGVVGLEGADRKYPHELSGGQRQRVALARSLAPCPSVILLDEPFSNLDAELRVSLRNETKEILKANGATVVLVTHDQEEAFSLSDRVGLLNAGKLEQVDVPYKIYHNPVSRFVAEFTGIADFVPANAQAGEVVSALGRFRKNGFEHSDSTQGHLMIRPDDVKVVPDPHGGAVVTGVRFLGADALYTLGLPEGILLHSLMSSTSLIPEGSRVKVTFDPEHTVFFPA